jgi:signal transduction histidine kinase
MFTKSIKWRLLLWMACLLTLILTGLGVAVYENHLGNRMGQFDEQLRQRFAALGESLFSPQMPGPDNRGRGFPGGDFGPQWPGNFQGGPNFSRPDNPASFGAQPSTATSSQLGQNSAGGFYFVLWSRYFAAPFRQSTNTPANMIRPQSAGRDARTYFRNRGELREICYATAFGDCMLVGGSLAPIYADARQFGGALFLGGVSILALVLGGAWWLVSRALQPVEKITAAALKISSGDLSQRISVGETESELGKLAAVLNSTFARLETSFAQQKQFTSDAAHELRTPLAVLISEAQTMLARERSPADYRESLAACLDTAQKMRQLAGSLLELARLDAGQEKLHRDKYDLAVLARDCVALVQPLADARKLQVHCQLSPAETNCDAMRISQVITNLLSNAINFNKDGGRITVTTRAENGRVILSVADTGCGFSPADLPHAFERFYRADKSRSTPGNGLGLSICKAIVTAHGGTIVVSSQENAGTVFTVTLSRAA